MKRSKSPGVLHSTAIAVGAAIVGLLGAGAYLIARGVGKQIATAVAVAKGRA